LGETAIKDLEINRLCTWCSIKTTTELKAHARQPDEDDRCIERVELDFCSVDLDINTVPRDQLPHEMLPQLFAELIDLGTQVAATGDEELCK